MQSLQRRYGADQLGSFEVRYEVSVNQSLWFSVKREVYATRGLIDDLTVQDLYYDRGLNRSICYQLEPGPVFIAKEIT